MEGAVESHLPSTPNPNPSSPPCSKSFNANPNLWQRCFLVFILLLQILFMVFYWVVYTIYLIAEGVFAPGRGGELTTFGAFLTAFVVISIAVTGYELVLLLLPLFGTGRRGKRIGATTTRTKRVWLSVSSCVVGGVWMVLPLLYLVWVIRNPYVEVFAGEVWGMGGACLVFLGTAVWNALKLWDVWFEGDVAIKDAEETAPLLGGEDTDGIEQDVGSS